jgi:hypothetical protein
LLKLSAAALLLVACGHDAYYVRLRTRNLLQADAATMTALESKAKSLGLDLRSWNERVPRDGYVVSSLFPPDNFEMQIYWITAPGSPGFGVSVGSRGKGVKEARPRIDEIAGEMLKVLTDLFGKDNVSVERDDRKVWIF